MTYYTNFNTLNSRGAIMNIRHIMLLLKAKRINTPDKYSKFLKQSPIALNQQWENFDGFQNNLDTKNYLSADFYNKKIILNDDLSLWNIDKIAGKGTTFQKAINIMSWLTEHTFYSGMSLLKINDKTSDILNKTVDKGFKFAMNCRLKAIALTDMLQSIGIHAIPILLLAITPTYKNKSLWFNHFMVHIYLPEENRWIVVDPSFNVHFVHNDKSLNILELADLLSKDIFPTLKGYCLNGSHVDSIDIYKKSFLRNSLEFILTWESGARSLDNIKKFGCEFNYLLEPKNYNLLDALKLVNSTDFLGESISQGYPKKIKRINSDDLLHISLKE